MSKNQIQDTNLKQVEQDKLINKLNKKLNYLKEKELTLDELKLKYDTLEKKVEENALNEVKMKEKDVRKVLRKQFGYTIVYLIALLLGSKWVMESSVQTLDELYLLFVFGTLATFCWFTYTLEQVLFKLADKSD